MLKLLHIADLHLDSRFSGIPLSESVKRRAALREVFKNALALAKREGCVATLICGDLFDGEYYTSDTLRFLKECFASMPEHKFIITPGNHDPYSATSPYRYADFPNNVYIFKYEELSCLSLNDIGINIYGYAFTSQIYRQSPLNGFAGAIENGNFNILCAHTELNGVASPYAPISVGELERYGFDYAALGHIHTDGAEGKAGHTVYAYSGCIASRDFSEHGEKGGIILTLDRSGGQKFANITRVKLCPWVYETAAVSVDGAASTDAAFEMIHSELSARGVSGERIIRLRLTGAIEAPLDTELLLSRLAPLGVTEIKDGTTLSFASLGLDNDFSLRGAFYKTLKDKLTSSDPEVQRNASLALQLGLTALNSGEIDI